MLQDVFKFIICPVVTVVMLQLFSEWLRRKRK